ncbi:protein YhfH [Bacillus massilinigeriensis]|nr:protein YhfH [Bacillus massilionigeriensis]
MLGSIVDFFKNLPAKPCSKCSQPIEEQHDCYGDKCNTCLGLTDL